jgi:hypothetical protein
VIQVYTPDESPAHIAPATPEELDGLRYIRSCERLAWITLAVTLPGLFLGYFLPPAAVYVIAPLALVAVFVALGRHMRCRCPRCGELFNMTKVRGHVWASECAHCGLPLKAQR